MPRPTERSIHLGGFAGWQADDLDQRHILSLPDAVKDHAASSEVPRSRSIPPGS